MGIIAFLSVVIAVLAVLTSIVLIRRVKKQIAEMTGMISKPGRSKRRELMRRYMSVTEYSGESMDFPTGRPL